MKIKTLMCVLALVAWALTSTACTDTLSTEQTTRVSQALAPEGPVDQIEFRGAYRPDRRERPIAGSTMACAVR